VRGLWSGQEVPPDGWTDVSSTMHSGSLMVRVPPGSTAVMYAGDDTPLFPRVIDRSSDGARIEIQAFDHKPGSLGARMAADGASRAGLENYANTYRIEMRAPESAPASVLVALGGIPTMAIARATLRPAADAASVFSIDTAGLLRTPDAVSEVLLMARDDQAQLTGHGWSAVDHDPVGPYRWMTGREARLLLPIARPAPRVIRMQAMLESAGAPATVRVRVNRTELPGQALRAGWAAYEWSLPPGATEPGTNEVAVIVEGLPARTGATAAAREVAVSDVRVVHAVR
jgi:hypothetical protein